MITNTPGARRWIRWASTVAISAVTATAARADVGPPVEIKMPADTQQAVSGQEYAGTFQVHVYQPGKLADFRILAEGWTVVEFQPPADAFTADVGTVSIPFRAVPSDADQSIGLTFTFNGRRVSQRYEVGPRYFTTASQGYRSRRIADTAPGPRGSCPADQVQCVGRIVYTRPDGEVVGADRIQVELRDIDPVGHEVMWSGTTGVRGYFDTGCVDADIDGDGSGPDLVLYYETQTDWVDVTDNSIGELTYWWDTGEIVDFEGSFHDFGVITPSASSTHPAIHVFNTVTRIRRFVEEVGGHTPSKVQVEWPVEEWTHYQDGPEEIHLQAQHQWNEDVTIHEYGHHFIHNYSSPPSTAYCNGLCDNNPPEDCGHCAWCPENASDAFNEGWPNWLADVMKRSMIQDERYKFDDGEAYVPFDYFWADAFEWVSTCGVEPVGDFGDPVMTEGFVAALLRDIEDETQDDQDGDGIPDLLCLGAGPNLAVLVNDSPTTVTEFISAFINRYPDEIDGLWPTARNVGGTAYTGGFPADTQPPGAVTVLDSPSHPLGVGGGLSCITFEWDAAPDDRAGATAYSYFLHQEPAGIEPDEGADPVTLTDHCKLSARAPAGILGNWYFSIKARDSLGKWSSQWTTFGPFQVLDCNGSGLLDICDIDCLHTGEPGGGICEFAISPCIGEPDCGTISLDCNENLQPDECDIAGGISEDCNNDGIPDECQPMKNYTGLANIPEQSPPADATEWGDPRNWLNLDAPVDGDMACIRSGLPIPLVVFSDDSLRLESISCEVNLGIVRLESWFPDLELDAPSFINGDLTISGISVLKVNDTLDVAGKLNWSGGGILGPGSVNVSGGLDLNPPSRTELRSGAHLSILDGTVDNHNSKYMELYETSIFTIGQPVTYTYNGDFNIFAGSPTTTVDVDGTLIRESGAGRATISSRVQNDGLIHNQTGELYMGGGGTHSGDVVSDPGTLLTLANGTYEWLTGSSLTADDVTLSAAFGTTIGGNVNIGGTLAVGLPSSSTLTFTDEANVTSYGQHLFARAGFIYFESPVAPAIDLDSMTVGEGTVYCGNPYFDTGETFVMNTLDFVCGTINGADPITINDSFVWRGGSIFAGGAVTCLGPVTIHATSGQRDLTSIFNNTAHATFLGQFTVSGAGRFNNLATGIVDLQGDNTGLTGGQSTNAGTITKTAGAGQSILSGMTNNGLIHAQTGEIAFFGTGMNHGDIVGDPGTLLSFFNGTHEMHIGSTLTADNVSFVGNTGTIRGDVNITGTLTLGSALSGGNATFTADGNATSYGHTLLDRAGFVRFESPVPAPTLEFDAVTIGGGVFAGTVYFDTGQPVGIGTLSIVNGNVDGADPITIHDAFTWGGVGSFFPGGMVTCNAPWTLQATSSQRDMHRDFLNNGYASLYGAVNLGSGADFTNQPAGVVDFKSNAGGFGLTLTSHVQNNGVIVKSGGAGDSLISTHFTNAGTLEILTGRVNFQANYTLNFIQTAGTTILNGGDLATLGNPYNVQGGDLAGIGTVFGDVNNSGGRVTPGLSAGVLTIDGDCTQGADATLAIEIGGSNQGTDHDLLDITGTTALAGTLEVTLIDGFVPNSGDLFEIVTAGTVAGEFDSVVFTNPPDNLELSVTYAADSVTLAVTGPVPGDCDGDGDVDLEDYFDFEGCLSGPMGGTGTGCECFDFDGNGNVDLLDFAEFQTVLNE